MRYVLLLFICILTLPVIAQEYPHTFRLSLGYPHFAMNSKIKTSLPVLAIQYERMIGRLGIAGTFAYSEFDGFDQDKVLSIYFATPVTAELFILAIRANYYLLQYEKLDIYGGIMLGYMDVPGGVYLGQEPVYDKHYSGMKGKDLAANYSGIKVGCQIGGRFWPREHFGFMGEIGYGTALINIGICYRR